MNIKYQIIPIEKDNLFDDVNIDILDQGFTNIYTCGLNTISKIEMIKELPIKNIKLAIKQILSFIKYIEVQSNILDSDIITIPQDLLIKSFNRNTYVKFLKLLNELNIVKAVPYEDGTYFKFKSKDSDDVAKPKRYKLTDEYKRDELCIVVIDDKKELKYEIEGTYNKNFIKTIKETEIDIKSAVRDEIRYNKGKDSLRNRLSTIFNLYEKRYIKKGYRVDRVYHSLTNISKVSRKHLRIKGLKFNNIDIKNCQPLLLCYYLLKNNLNIDDKYIQDCELGTLYERFLIKGKEYIDYEFKIKDGKIVGKNKIVIKIDYNEIGDDLYDKCRDKIKVLLYKSIYFDFKSDSDISIMFKSLYPSVYSELENLYSGDIQDEFGDIKMASRLQNIEAEIFNNITPKFSKYYFTLFDAVYFTDESDAGHIMIDLLDKFRRYGLVPKLKYNDDVDIN